MKNLHSSRGFTIVELLIVIVVIGILAAIATVAYNGVTKNARTAVVKNDLSTASTQLEQYRITNSNDQYPTDLDSANVKASAGTNYQYTYDASANAFCLTASNTGIDYFVTSANKTATSGVCTGHQASGSGPTLPSGSQAAPVASGASTSVEGYAAVQPSSCPSTGGSWIKVPGNALYNKPNGFCVQQYPAVNVNGVATSQNTGNKWTSITVANASTAANAVDANTHLFTEDEWMTVAANAAAQPSNWSGGAVGSGSLSSGASSATAHGQVSFNLSNGETIYFDTSSYSYYAGVEWTCYTGTGANGCLIAQKDQPAPAGAKYTYALNTMTNFGTLTTKNGYYYGDPRYANSALTSYVNSTNLQGMGYMKSNYSSSATTLYGTSRGYWRGSNVGGLFTLYMDTRWDYAHANFGFRAASG